MEVSGKPQVPAVFSGKKSGNRIQVLCLFRLQPCWKIEILKTMCSMHLSSSVILKENEDVVTPSKSRALCGGGGIELIKRSVEYA
jgi:hypothetical protein